MDYVLFVSIIVASLCGLVDGLLKVQKTKMNSSLGVESSKNIFTFMFADKYTND